MPRRKYLVGHVLHWPCPECGGEMVLRRSRFGLFYGCAAYPQCKAAHGCHPDGRPLGKPATKETKQWRIKAHAAFDPLWKEGSMKRGDAYRWLAKAMGRNEAHIGEMDIKDCQQVIALCEAKSSVKS